MKVIILFLISCCITLSSYSLFGQGLEKIPNVTPMAPDAASIFKVLERPLGSFTGTVPVSFPLLSIASGTLMTSLALNYNSTGGIRVEEVAGSTGLGFSLSGAGGVITQQIRGKPDSFVGVNSLEDRPSSFGSDIVKARDAMDEDGPDLEPDIFYFNFGNKTGKFFINENREIVISENTGLKIEYFYNTSYGNNVDRWVITDEHGNKFYFGQNKTQTANYWLDHSYVYQSEYTFVTKTAPPSRSWYLTEVKDMNEENTLTYSYVISSQLITNYAGGYLRTVTFGNMGTFGPTTESGTVQTDASEYIVSRIDGRDDYILVNSGSRSDGMARKVESIELFSRTNELKQKFRFNYGYFTSNRLKLKSLSQHSIDGTDSLVHKFEYEENVNLPNRESNSVDIWGFFNGNYNTSLFPNYYYRYSVNGQVVRLMESANRTAVFECAKANVLQKIIYPTGGKREFIHEGNTALMVTNGEHLIDPRFTNTRSFTRSVFFESMHEDIPCMTEPFSVNSTDGGTIFRYTLTGITVGCYYHVKLIQIDNGPNLFGEHLIDDVYNKDTYSWEVSNGDYRIEVYKVFPGCGMDALHAEWGESTLSRDFITTPYGDANRNNLNVGGIRIKEIKDYDPMNNLTYKTEYKYQMYSTDSTFTSGMMVAPLRLITMENPGSMSGRHLALHVSNALPLASHGGSYVVYPEVRTIENGNGWTDSKFTLQGDIPNYGFPTVPDEDNSHDRGNLLQESKYRNDGKLLKKTTYDYQIADGGYQYSIRYKLYYYRGDIGDTDVRDHRYQLPSTIDWNVFYTSAKSAVMISKIDSTYVEGGGIVASKTSYNHYNFRHQLIPRQIITSINGGHKSSTFKYPFTSEGEFVFGLNTTEQSTKSLLLLKNYLQPLEVVDSIKTTTGIGSILGGSKNVMSSFSGRLHISQIRDYLTPSEFKELNISAYDIAGNITEKYRLGGPKEVFIWGYNYAYPVAKVVGSNYETVNALVNNLILQSPSSTIDDINVQLNSIRIGLSNSNTEVSTYSYNPRGQLQFLTDGSGKRTSYQYDNFMRLKNIQNVQNEIIKSFKYHYRTNNTTN